MTNEEAVKWFRNELNSLSHIQYVCGFDYLRFKKQRMMILFAIKALEAQENSGWIPIKYRPLTEKERIVFAEHYGIEYCDTSEEKAFDCPMPEDKQEILISTSWGVVEDYAENDVDGEGFICYGLEINGDWDCVEAWMPKPKPYTKEATNDE